MEYLTCDIKLGGSTSQFIRWNLENCGFEDCVKAFNTAIYYRAKTKPFKVAKRVGCLYGLVLDEMDLDRMEKNNLLDALALAIKKGP